MMFDQRPIDGPEEAFGALVDDVLLRAVAVAHAAGLRAGAAAVRPGAGAVTANDGTEILIPFVEQIVPEVNVAEKFILVTPPPGLFEVNAEDARDEDQLTPKPETTPR